MIPDPTATAPCLVCGELVTYLMAPLHIEDHKARGDMLPDHRQRRPPVVASNE